MQDLGLLVPVREHKAEIFEKMSQSFAMRQDLRRTGETIHDMMEKFPHLGNFDGEVVIFLYDFPLLFFSFSNLVFKTYYVIWPQLHAEFLRIHPNAKDMCRRFLKLLPNILKLPAQGELELTFEDGKILFYYFASLNPVFLKVSL